MPFENHIMGKPILVGILLWENVQPFNKTTSQTILKKGGMSCE